MWRTNRKSMVAQAMAITFGLPRLLQGNSMNKSFMYRNRTPRNQTGYKTRKVISERERKLCNHLIDGIKCTRKDGHNGEHDNTWVVGSTFRW